MSAKPRLRKRIRKANWICPTGAQAVTAHVTGTVWKLLVQEGDRVKAGKPVLVVESMKMEFAVDAPVGGTDTAVVLQGRRARLGRTDAARDSGGVNE